MNSSSSAAALLVLLLAASVLLAAAAPVGSDPPTSCCFSFTSRKIPRSHVADYYETNSRCSQPAIVFITRKKREICANPSERWVQEYVNDLELN
ncbi:C-C motif chemokine 4-like [Sceloporus undulatus]|uniref:C-C motif chemokine 4-like n=1 Tax=Sceloporus undulatus TaxID=8520 RepID=UPI001C4DBA81|nr:C-C motif chemokine 4-like [Sceloporus undulatus]